MSFFANNLLNYYTSTSSSEIAFSNLKKINPSLNEHDTFALAFMACNVALSEEEREIYKKCLELKIKKDCVILDELHRNKNSMSNEPVSNDKEE